MMLHTTTSEAPLGAQHSTPYAAPDPALGIERAITYLQSALKDLRAHHPESAATFVLEARRHCDKAFVALVPDAPSQ